MLTACGGSDKKETKAETKAETTAETGSEAKESAAADGESLKVALCVTGAVNDMGWCQSAYDGLKLLEEKIWRRNRLYRKSSGSRYGGNIYRLRSKRL